MKKPAKSPALPPPAAPQAPKGSSRALIGSDDIGHALRAANGLVSVAAKQLGMARQSLYERINREPELAAILKDARETVLDIAEGRLLQKVNQGDLGAICFLLKCQGKARGWIEKPESEIHLHQNMQVQARIEAEKAGELAPAKARALELSKHFSSLAAAAARDSLPASRGSAEGSTALAGVQDEQKGA